MNIEELVGGRTEYDKKLMKLPQESIETKILQRRQEKPKAATEQLARVLGISAKTVKRHIGDRPKVFYVGSGHWEVAE